MRITEKKKGVNPCYSVNPSMKIEQFIPKLEGVAKNQLTKQDEVKLFL
jgi:hypothetical protein